MSLLAVTSGDIASGVVEAEGIDLDGTYDYLNRSTDLVGNVDSKTFTFSAWVYFSTPNAVSDDDYIYGNDLGRFRLYYRKSVKTLYMLTYNSAGTAVASLSMIVALENGWNNILISWDTATTNRHLYINDIMFTATYSTWTNDFIDFTTAIHTIGSTYTGASKLKGRISNIFLSYEYMDLSIVENRRIFINEDGTAVV